MAMTKVNGYHLNHLVAIIRVKIIDRWSDRHLPWIAAVGNGEMKENFNRSCDNPFDKVDRIVSVAGNGFPIVVVFLGGQ